MIIWQKSGRKKGSVQMFNKLLRSQKAKLEEQISLIEKSIQEREQYLGNINSQVEQSKQILNEIQNKLIKSKAKLNDYQHELGIAEGIITMQDLGMEYTPACNDLDKLAIKKADIQKSIASLINNDEAIITTRVYRIDGSEAKGRQFQKAFCENLLIGFNTYYNQKKKSATQANIAKTEDLLEKKFTAINNKASLMGVYINHDYLSLCVRLLYVELDEKITKAEERERIKEERRRLREQEKLLAEAEKERKRLEDEKKAMNLAYRKALTEEERNDIIQQIQAIDKRIDDIDFRVSNPKAGWVYVIESPSLKGMVKIGTSRRLNGPFERVRELSGSSLPEAFRINGFCFSDDAFALENNMHKYFAKQRVNPNKEFFYITPQEAIKVLKEEFSCDVHFVNEEESEDENGLS